jgi:hypothetical protein
MSHPCGPPHKLTRVQIRRVLRWHARGVAFRATHGTAHDLARKLRVSVYAVRRALQDNGIPAATGAVGRKRLLSPAHDVIVRRWRAAGRRFRATHFTAQKLADALGVGRVTIYDCIRRRGRYAAVRSARIDQAQVHARSGGRRSAATRHIPSDAVAQRAALLRAWPRATSSTQPRRIPGPQAKPPRAHRGDRS